ncbi:hypothetical protein [Rhodococcus pyridinivorans]|uniref:Uncharacterized protein n=1 Tax=Rhodococcus pyridinivorans TaxID=103816 RepID=A0A7M2XQ18_9NOCA|nr:hypothetical protein [Rhodococcus pyridinivorans]QOV99493.1 hypothetical protein INP59_03565 [Rhodococcus pyridinivorans]
MTGIARPDGNVAEIARMGVARPDGTVAEVREAWVYDGGQWKKVWASFMPTGIDKSGNFTLPNTGVYHPLVGWVKRAGYPDGEIYQNAGILVPEGASVTVAGAVTFGGAGTLSGGTMRARVMINGLSELLNAPSPASSAVIPFGPTGWINTTGADAILTVEAYTTSTLSNRNVVQGGSGTFLTVTPL